MSCSLRGVEKRAGSAGRNRGRAKKILRQAIFQKGKGGDIPNEKDGQHLYLNYLLLYLPIPHSPLFLELIDDRSTLKVGVEGEEVIGE